MSGDFPFPTKTVSPVKCNEKPWDLWIGEIGYRSPRREDDAKGERAARRRRSGRSRLRVDAMSLHGMLPQADALDAAVCHLCGAVVKCSAAYRHLRDRHSAPDPLLPPPPPAPALKPRARPRKDPQHHQHPPPHQHQLAPPAPPPPPDAEPLYLDETAAAAAAAAALAADVQVSVDGGDLPVVSIQDPEDLALGENITDDIYEIMNSEGIQSADDITNVADWKNIIRDIGNLPDINFPTVADAVQNPELYLPGEPALGGYAIPDVDLSALQFVADAAAPPDADAAAPVAPSALGAPAVVPPAAPPAKPSTPSSRAARRTSKSKFNLREYDPNKHCGVLTAESQKPCTRSLTCKAHTLSLRRAVDGRAKPFDTLLAEHRAARDAAHQQNQPHQLHAHQQHQPPAAPPPELDLAALNGLDERVDAMYHLIAEEDPDVLLPDTSAIAPLLSQPPPEPEPAPAAVAASAGAGAGAGAGEPADGVCWYTACPRPLALCTFNASHAGGAVTLGKRYATVRGNMKSSLTRAAGAAGAAAGVAGAGGEAAARGTRTARPELRRLVLACGAAGVGGAGAGGVHDTLAELFAGEARLNGHAPQSTHARPRLKHGKRPAVLDLGFSLDPLLADEKC